MANGKNSVFRIILGVLSFFLSFFFALCVLNTVLDFSNPLQRSRNDDSVSVGVLTGEIIAVGIFIGLTVAAFWGGLRLMKAPKRKKEKIELLGEHF